MTRRIERCLLSALIAACIVGLAVAAFDRHIEGARNTLTVLYCVFLLVYLFTICSEKLMTKVAAKGPTWSRLIDPFVELALACVLAWFGAWWLMGVQLLGFCVACKISELQE